MAILDLSLNVDAESEALFDFVVNPESERLYNPDLLDIRPIGDGPVATGAEWEGRYKGMGVTQIKLDEYERPTRVVFDTTGKRMDMRLAFTFSPDGSGTRLPAHAGHAPQGSDAAAGPADDADGQAQLFQASGSAESRARRLPRDAASPDGSRMRQSGRV